VRWYDNIFSKDSDPDDNGQKTKSEWNNDGGNDDDGIFGPLGGQIPGANEPGVEQAPNNNVDGRNLEAFDWDGFSDDGIVGGAYPRNRSPTPSGDGGARDIQSSEDYVMFAVVMTEATAMCGTKMMMTAATMCRTEMMRRLPTTMLLVVMSRLLLKGYRMTSLDSPRRCPYNKGRKSIFQKGWMKT
jgi:hypothetical protein